MTELAVPVAVMAALILLNGLFVAAEFAIVGAPRATIDHWAARGDRLARRVKRILDRPGEQDRYLATAQIGITLASLGLGMYGEHELAEWLARELEAFGPYRWLAAHTLASIVAIAILTYLHIVIGEMVPKALALQHAARTACYITPVMLAIERILYPLVVGLNSTGNGLLAAMGIRREVGAERYHTSEELQFVVEESRQGGALRGEAGTLLRELFEFGDLTAGMVMTPRVHVVGVPDGASPETLRRIVKAGRYTRYPVYVGNLDTIVGSLHIKEVLRLLTSDQPVTAQAAHPLPCLPQMAPLADVLAAMRRVRTQIAVVMDEYGGTAGLVTIEDLFEEVVGDIDERRGPQPVLLPASGGLVVRGTLRLSELSAQLGIGMDHPQVSTVSGLVLALLGRPAAVGDTVTWKGTRLDVLTVLHRGVGSARVTLPGSRFEASPDPAPPPRRSPASSASA
jgi:CBS domain containing-hemolysin-like protein